MKGTAIVYFDGICNFCNGFVNFVIKNDRKDYFRYTALQSGSGKIFCEEHSLPTDKLETFYLFENGKVYSRSTAALRLLKNLGWKFSWMYIFIILPSWFRDTFFYNPVARNRYKWFGKTDSCMVPSAEVRAKFLD